MAMFLFSPHGFALLLIECIFLILQNGLISNRITAEAMRGNAVISNNFLQIQPPPFTRLFISHPHVPYYLPCSASINPDKYERAAVELFTYIWYRNDIELKSFAHRRADFQLFRNGTLRLPTNENATGVYRCLVNATAWGYHAVLSESCTVEYPVLKRISSQPNVTAVEGMPLTLSCPVLSVPAANISWIHGNSAIEQNVDGNRYTQLTNGSLVIKTVTDRDKGKYKCIAQNAYAVKSHRQFSLVVNIMPFQPPHNNNIQLMIHSDKLLPPLQEEFHYIPVTSDLKLCCMSFSESTVIEWWFQKSLHTQPKKISNNSAIYIRNASVERDEGHYTCITKSDSQLFQVVVIGQPKIIQPLQSYESALAAFVNYSCNATGNPSPKFSWYHNGRPLLADGFTTNIEGNNLTIHSFDLANEGIYQCFARNIAGESYSAALLRLSHREELDIIPKSLRNIRCFAINFNTINVTFLSGTTPLYFISVHFVQKNPYVWESRPPLQLNHTDYVIISGHMPIYKPFTILTRALLPMSTHRYSNTGSVEETMKSSFLSKPASCCTQGLPTHEFYLSTGVLVTWSYPELNAKYFIIQFSVAFTRPHPEDFFRELPIQGIFSTSSVLLRSTDFENELQNISPLTKTQSRDILSKMQSDLSNKDFTEEVYNLVVLSNVTGVFLKGCLQAKLRVLIVTYENEDLKQDFRYVQWKMIENNTGEQSLFPFKITCIESRSVLITFVKTFTEECIQLCYYVYETPELRSSRRICQDMILTSSRLVLRELKPRKNYKLLLYSCSEYRYFGEVDVQTLPDPPGTITNQKVTKQNGLKLSWDAPMNPNGKIYFYSIFWTVNNTTHETNVSSSETYFKFPNTTENEKINVTIRVVGENGVGAPIYIDLRNVRPEHLDNERVSLLDAYWGVAIGAALSSFCILFFCLIFVYQRHRFKIRNGQMQLTSQSESNVDGLNPSRSRSATFGLDTFVGDNTGLSGGPTDNSTINEYHELQTLIPKSQNIQTFEGLQKAQKQLPNGNGNWPHQNENSSECILSEVENDEAPSILHSSTPLITRMSQMSCCNDTPYIIPVVTKDSGTIIHPTSNSNHYSLNKISSSPSFYTDSGNIVCNDCRISTFSKDYNHKRQNNRSSQLNPGSTVNSSSFNVNTENTNSCGNSNSNNKARVHKTSHPAHQNGCFPENDLKTLSGSEIEKAPNGSMIPIASKDVDVCNSPLNSNINNKKRDPSTEVSSKLTNNNSLSWQNKQQISNWVDNRFQPPSTTTTENNSTIGFETPLSTSAKSDICQTNDGDHTKSLYHSLPTANCQESGNLDYRILKRNWSARTSNVDTNS